MVKDGSYNFGNDVRRKGKKKRRNFHLSFKTDKAKVQSIIPIFKRESKREREVKNTRVETTACIFLFTHGSILDLHTNEKKVKNIKQENGSYQGLVLLT